MRGSPRYPHIRIDLDGVERTKGIVAISQGDLKHTAIKALEWLCLFRLPALSGNGERVEHIGLDVCREILEVPARRLDPGDASGVSHLGRVDIFVNTLQACAGHERPCRTLARWPIPRVF